GGAARDARLHQQPVEPEIEVEADPHYRLRLLDAREVLRARLILLGIEARRDQARHRDAVAADRLGEALEIAGGCDDGEALLGLRRRPARAEERGGESEWSRPRAPRGPGILCAPPPPAPPPHLAVCQMLFGITQWTFFSASEMAPTRQSIATLASP